EGIAAFEAANAEHVPALGSPAFQTLHSAMVEAAAARAARRVVLRIIGVARVHLRQLVDGRARVEKEEAVRLAAGVRIGLTQIDQPGLPGLDDSRATSTERAAHDLRHVGAI